MVVPVGGYDQCVELPGGHQRIDQRSLALHRAIADKLRKDPGLIRIARENLVRWRTSAGRSLPYLDEWEHMLDLPLDELLLVITDDTERMTALRQSSPFAGVLKPAERWAIYAQFSREGQVGMQAIQ